MDCKQDIEKAYPELGWSTLRTTLDHDGGKGYDKNLTLANLFVYVKHKHDTLAIPRPVGTCEMKGCKRASVRLSCTEVTTYDWDSCLILRLCEGGHVVPTFVTEYNNSIITSAQYLALYDAEGEIAKAKETMDEAKEKHYTRCGRLAAYAITGDTLEDDSSSH